MVRNVQYNLNQYKGAMTNFIDVPENRIKQ